MWKPTRLLIVAVLLAVPQITLAQRAQFLADDLKQFVTTDAPVIAIRNVRVIDGTGGEALDGQTILIRDGRLEHVGLDVSIPRRAEVIDGTGFTALPGLVMMHEHLFYRTRVAGVSHYSHQPVAFPRLYLAGGATTIRTAGSHHPLQDLQVKRAIEDGRLIGPDIDVTGPYLDGPDSTRYQTRELSTPAEAQQFISTWADLGATSFKAFMALKPTVLRAAVEAAHARGLKVTGHLCATGWAQAAEAGIDNLEHGLFNATDFYEQKRPGECPGGYLDDYLESGLSVDSPKVRTLIDTLIANNVAVTATLLGVHCNSGRPVKRALEMLNPRGLAEFAVVCPPEGQPDADAKFWARLLKLDQAATLAFHRAGGLLLAGTDPTIEGVIPGFGNHWQLELMVESGLTPLEALKVASHNGAKYLESLKHIGTLEKGKQADIVMVRGRPDENISDIRNVEIVFKQGIGYDSAKLIESVKGTIG